MKLMGGENHLALGPNFDTRLLLSHLFYMCPARQGEIRVMACSRTVIAQSCLAIKLFSDGVNN